MTSFAIVPAAGRSVRMGQPKLLLPWGDSTVIETVLDAWRQGGVSRVIVVVHPNDADLAAVCRKAGAETVVPTEAPPEMKDSIGLGLERVRSQHQPTLTDVWLLAPADMPLIAPAAIRAVLQAHNPAAPAILVPTHRGRRGHPVLFPWPLAQEVFQLVANEGVNSLVHRHGSRAVELPQVAAVDDDIDTPEDYRRLRPAP